MTTRFPCHRLFSLVAVLFTCQATLAAAEERTRSFDIEKCRYTLPGPHWAWVGGREHAKLFQAKDSTGRSISLIAVAGEPKAAIDAQSALTVEDSIYKNGGASRRSGRFFIFKGLPAFQLEGRSNDGGTFACRTFIAHQHIFMMLIISGSESPIEADDDFEMLMNGWELTVPFQPPQASIASLPDKWPLKAPQPADQVTAPPLGVTDLMVLGLVIAGLLLVFCVVMIRRRNARMYGDS